MPALISPGHVALLLLAGCPPKAPPETAHAALSPPPTAAVVQLQVDPTHPPAAPREPPEAEVAALRVLDEARPRAASCYQAALGRDPAIHGEVLVRVAVGPDGRIGGVAAAMDTVGDRELVSCVERLVQALHFPPLGGEGVSLRYPFLFSTDLTPPEVVRAMLSAHGLLEEEEQSADVEAAERAPTPGTVETW